MEPNEQNGRKYDELLSKCEVFAELSEVIEEKVQTVEMQLRDTPATADRGFFGTACKLQVYLQMREEIRVQLETAENNARAFAAEHHDDLIIYERIDNLPISQQSTTEVYKGFEATLNE